MLINLMENLIQMRVDSVMKMNDMCVCEKCRLDVMALALNRLPSRYVVGDQGNAFTAFELNSPQGSTEIFAALVSAANIVKKSPKHDGYV